MSLAATAGVTLLASAALVVYVLGGTHVYGQGLPLHESIPMGPCKTLSDVTAIDGATTYRERVPQLVDAMRRYTPALFQTDPADFDAVVVTPFSDGAYLVFLHGDGQVCDTVLAPVEYMDAILEEVYGVQV